MVCLFIWYSIEILFLLFFINFSFLIKAFFQIFERKYSFAYQHIHLKNCMLVNTKLVFIQRQPNIKLFLAHLVKGHVNFCHHLMLSFFCQLFTFESSPLRPMGQMNQNLVGSIYGRTFIKSTHFVPIHLQTWPPYAILVSDCSISKNLLLLKPLGLIKRNFTGSIY